MNQPVLIAVLLHFVVVCVNQTNSLYFRSIITQKITIWIIFGSPYVLQEYYTGYFSIILFIYAVTSKLFCTVKVIFHFLVPRVIFHKRTVRERKITENQTPVIHL